MSGIGSPPKKARAMTGDTAHTSGGPKRASHAVLSNSRTLTHNCCVSRSKEPMLNGLNMKTKFGNKVVTSNSETRIGAMQRSSLVENQKATEKAQDVSLLLHQDTNEVTKVSNIDDESQTDCFFFLIGLRDLFRRETR